ncbi:MAG: DUF4350 domain-containing protein [Dehalococcoidales bacterium]|nr:DUF4350 domain-containing protein [Dehalococcoidales bacterium]
MALHKFLLLLALVLVLTLAVVVWFVPSNEDFRAENDYWNGTASLLAESGIQPVDSLSGLPDFPNGATIILIPYTDFQPAELESVKGFISRGGTLVLADDYGNGNRVLEYLGLKARFSRQALLDPLSNYNSQWFPRIIHFTDNFLTHQVEELVFNHATSLADIASDEIIAQSSMFSFLDANNNQNWDEGEATGRMPVISRHSLGKGQIILIADASIFINSMSEMPGNRRLLTNLAGISPAGLYLDQSHLPPSNLHQAKNTLAATRSLLTKPLGLLLLMVLAFALTLFPLWHHRPLSRERSPS